MSNVVFFSPRSELDARQNLHDFVSYCRGDLALYEDQGGFAVDSWKFELKGKAIAMVFSRFSDKNSNYSFDVMDEPFLSFSKAYVRYHQSKKQVATVREKLVALRAVHDALLGVYDCADPIKIDGQVQVKAAEILNQRYLGSTKLYQFGGQLEILYDFLREKAITPALPAWKRPWKRQKEKAIKTDEASRKWQEERCPSMHHMLALASCFAQAGTVKDRYWSSVFALLMFAPSRGGELLDLTINSLHEEEGRLAVVWYGEKGFGETLKWVPSSMEPVVREAFQRLIEISRPARKAAKFVYDNPGKFFRHDQCITPESFLEGQPLNALQFANAMNFSEATKEKIKMRGADKHDDQTSWNILGYNSKWLIDLREDGSVSYEKLARYTAQKYKNTSWPYMPKMDRYVWDSLLLVREYEFHEDFAARDFSWVLPSLSQLNDQLASRPLKNPMPTIFQRFGYTDEDGSEIRLSSHQLRVWLSTNAERGGMDSWRLAQWAGRARIEDNRAYDLRTQTEREEKVTSLLKLEERPTALEAIKMNLPVSYDDLGLNRIGIAEVTEYGMCTHDYAMSPCTKGGECLTCKEHVCIKGMPKTLERIRKYESHVASQLKKAEGDAAGGIFGADRWVTHIGWKLAHIKTQRMRLESEKTPEGAVLWIPPEHDPSNVKRALDQRGYGAKSDQESLVDESFVADLLKGGW